MIITRSPLRITLGGGGTDLPSYSRQCGGFGIYLKCSQLEKVDTVDQVQHRIIREALTLFDTPPPQIESLGSSGSFTSSLLKALYTHRRIMLHPRALAELACDIEINQLHEPVRRQDQYASALGGATCFDFNKDDTVNANPLPLKYESLHAHVPTVARQ